MKSKIAVAAVAAMALVFGAIQISNAVSSPTYNACANKSTGALRLLASGKSCTKKETKISWNQRGPQGPAGVAGAAGSPGADGQQGIQGLPGQDGEDGADGGKAPIWIGANEFSLIYGDTDHAFLGKMITNGYYQPGYILKDRAANSGSDGIETRFAPPASWAGVTSVDVTFYFSAKSGTGDVQLWKGFGGFAAGSPMGTYGWNSLRFGPVNGSGTLEYNRYNFELTGSALYGIGIERSSDTNNTPDSNSDDVVFFGVLVEPHIA